MWACDLGTNLPADLSVIVARRKDHVASRFSLTAERGRHPALKARSCVLFSLASRERLTAPGATAQDTEKTVVSLYSKVKESARAAIFTRPCLGKML
jgi:hypothetical protein